MRNINRHLLLYLILQCILFSITNTTVSQIAAPGDYPVIKYTKVDTLISINDYFLNEGLNRPIASRKMEENESFAVLDERNTCIYIFDKDGGFKWKIGRKGRGPGELIHPIFLEIGENNQIYVYDSSLLRLTIFSYFGKYIDSFKLEKGKGASGQPGSGLSISGSNIIVNQPKNGYYITEYSNDGSLLAKIGKIEKIKKDSKIHRDQYYAEGFPFKLINGNYIIFLTHFSSIFTFNKKGDCINKIKLDFPEVLSHEKVLDPPSKEKVYIVRKYFTEVILFNDKYYLLIKQRRQKIKDTYDKEGNKIMSLSIYVLNKNYIVEKKIELPDYHFPTTDMTSRLFFVDRRFCVLNENEDIIIPNFYEAQILKYSRK